MAPKLFAMKKTLFPLMALLSGWLLTSLPACQKDDSCSDEWGVVGTWLSVERTQQYRDSVLTADLPGIWSYSFRADGTGQRSNQQSTYPFSWFYARAPQRLVVMERNETPQNNHVFTRSFALLEKNDQYLLLKDSSFFELLLPPDFIQRQRITTIHTVRLLNE